MSKKLKLWQIFGERSIVDMQPVGGVVACQIDPWHAKKLDLVS